MSNILINGLTSYFILFVRDGLAADLLNMITKSEKYEIYRRDFIKDDDV